MDNRPLSSGGLEQQIAIKNLSQRSHNLALMALALIPDLPLLRELVAFGETAAIDDVMKHVPEYYTDPATVRMRAETSKKRGLALLNFVEVVRDTQIELDQFLQNRLPAPAQPAHPRRRKRPPLTP